MPDSESSALTFKGKQGDVSMRSPQKDFYESPISKIPLTLVHGPECLSVQTDFCLFLAKDSHFPKKL